MTRETPGRWLILEKGFPVCSRTELQERYVIQYMQLICNYGRWSERTLSLIRDVGKEVNSFSAFISSDQVLAQTKLIAYQHCVHECHRV